MIRQRDGEKTDHVMALGQIKTALASGMAAARTLDAIVANDLREDPLTLEVWRRDRHVRAGRRTRAAVEPVSTDAVNPSTSPAPSASPAASTAL